MMTDLALIAATFGDRLHMAGLSTTPERSARFAQMLDVVSPTTYHQMYWTARLAFVIDPVMVDRFEAVFAEVFRGHVDVDDILRNPNAPERENPPQARGEDKQDRQGSSASSHGNDSPQVTTPATDNDDADGDNDDDDDDGQDALVAMAAEHEGLRAKAFGACTPAELEQLGYLISRLPLVPPLRRGRRLKAHHHRGDIHWRATLRQAHRTGGDPLRQQLRQPRQRPRRIVLLADVSGSMEHYARAYLYLLHGAVRAVGAEAFIFSTQLTRLTRQLAGRHPQVALAKAMAAAPDWSGGTKIGEAIAAFNDGWGRRGLARGAVVVIVSDGWDAGDPVVLGREMERLARLANRIIWVNPRRQSPTFQPLTGGMAAALPFLDHFVSGHSLSHLDDVLAAISGG
jgi:uncharacterized protein